MLKYLRGRCIIGAFETIYHEGTIFRVSRAIIYFILHKSIFISFNYKGYNFYNKYKNTEDKKRYIDDDNTGIK